MDNLIACSGRPSQASDQGGTVTVLPLVEMQHPCLAVGGAHDDFRGHFNLNPLFGVFRGNDAFGDGGSRLFGQLFRLRVIGRRLLLLLCGHGRADGVHLARGAGDRLGVRAA